jgi:hypothetical protein
MSPQRLTGKHKQRQTMRVFDYTVTYYVDGRDVTWLAQVSRGGRQWNLSGGGLELPEVHEETGLGLSATEIVRHDVHRAIDGMAA